MSGLRSKARNADCRKKRSSSTSWLSNITNSVSASPMVMLWAAAKPTFVSSATTCTRVSWAAASRRKSSVPSVEALSTTRSSSRPIFWRRTDITQPHSQCMPL